MTLESTPESTGAALLRLLRLERIDLDLFLGQNENRGMARLFGGQVLSQALRAACTTVDSDRAPHSMHGYFLRAGDPDRPVLYEVDRIRDGRSFTTRRVVAIQDGKAIFNMSVSLQIAEEGMTHAQQMPNVPPPEELENDLSRAAAEPEDNPRLSPGAHRERAFEMRHVIAPWEAGDRMFSPVWMRFNEALDSDDSTDSTDSALEYSLLAYASDEALVSTAALPHVDSMPRSALMLASLDHALWIHRKPSFDDWILFAKRTSTARGARGLSHAEFFSRDGELLASVTQEGLLRIRDQ